MSDKYWSLGTDSINSFPNIATSTADDFENVYSKIWKISIIIGIINENS